MGKMISKLELKLNGFNEPQKIYIGAKVPKNQLYYNKAMYQYKTQNTYYEHGDLGWWA